ncbi:MAG TPA: glycosyltransferase [Candidatus Levybacteria bacterium]|nr:glycosyltransferase [Candidatus Levybacteria bacterium]
MKVALVHDYIKEYGGAERVLEALHEIYPDAPIYTSLYFPEFLGPHKSRFEKMDIRTSWMQYIPFGYKLISPLRLLSPFAFESLNLSSYDVIITSQTGAYFPNLVRKGKGRLYSYTHTPPRYLYGYKTARDWKKNKVVAALAEVANHVLRMIDFNASKNVDQFIANSQEVSSRIKKFYRQDAVVIYPPVEISTQSISHKSQKKQPYYVAGGRLARAKGMDVIVDAFIKNKKPLKIFGKGFAGFEEELKSKIIHHASNIEFVGEVSDEEKLTLMAGAQAYIFASYDEDFGITPVEAMSVGTPVIAYKSGGVQETVVDGKTGLFYTPNTPDALNNMLVKFEKIKISSHDCIQQAQKFSTHEFSKKIQNAVK